MKALNPLELQHYNRHLILDNIGLEGQLKLKNAKVLVVGAGGLSCPLLQYLTAAGVGRIGIVDNDVVDQSNLQRQILYTYDDVGQPKAVTAAKRLNQLNPHVNFDVYNERLTQHNVLALFEAYDIIADGTDNFPTRYLVNDACVIKNKPLVFGSIFKFEGQISVFNYNNGPTYRCLYPTPPKPDAVPNCSQIGVLGVLPGIVGSLQANEVLKLILGLGDVLSGKLLTFNALTVKQLVFSFTKNPSIHITTLEANYQEFCGISEKEIITEINYKAYKEQVDNFNLLDVRTDAEREDYHIGGLHIPLDELEGRFKEIPQDKRLLVYCKSGMRSQNAIQLLEESGFKNSLVNLEGGLLQQNLL